MFFLRKYSRNFISLNQESSAYNYDLRPCIGKCIIEIKNNEGRLNMSVQGLKNEILYKVCLLSVENTGLKEVFMGFMNVDTSGKGESKICFNPDNINNSGLTIEDCNVIALIVENGAEIVSPLVGYVEEEIAWKDKYSANCGCSNNNSSDPDKDNSNIETEPSQPSIEQKEPLTEYERGRLEEEKGKLDYRKGKLDEIQGRLDYDKGKLDEAQGELEYEQGKIDEMQGYLDYIKGKLEGLPGDYDYEKGKLDEQKGKLEEQKGKLEEQKGNLEYEKGILDEQKGRLEYEKGKLDEQKGLLDYLAGKKEEEFWKNQNNSTVNTENFKNNYEEFNNLIEKFKMDMLKLEKKALISNQVESNSSKVTSKNLDIEYIKSKNPVMTPFEEQDNNITWYRICPNDLTVLDECSWKFANNQFVFSNYKKYKHLILGIKNDNNKESYVLAVPCKFDENFVPKGELAQFSNFIPLSNNVDLNNSEDVYGYRTLNIN